MSFTGDSISTLAIDANGANPSQMSNFMNILDQIQTTETAPFAAPSNPNGVTPSVPSGSPIKEGFASPSTTAKISMTKSLSVAVTLTIIMVILTLEPVQKLLDKVFKTKMTKIGVQALVFCLMSVILIHKL